MQDDNLVPIREFCVHHNIEANFIQLLQHHGLIELTTVEENFFIDSSKLGELEKMIHLHYDLEVNVEGIDVICHLLKRLEDAQEEIGRLKRQLRFYETRG